MFARRAIAALAFLALVTSARASSVAGQDYVVLKVPQPQETTGKIEVIEFFSWGCPHCEQFYPALARWVKALPKDVSFKRLPVGFGHPEWDNLARAYYALQFTNDLTRLDSQIFEAIHQEHVPLFDEPSITAWVGQHGVKVAEFKLAYRSFGVDTSLGQAQQAVIDYGVDGIPTLAIAGRYTVSGEHAKMLAVADELIAKARGEAQKPGK